MIPIQININGIFVDILSPLPDKINNFSVTLLPIYIPIPNERVVEVKKWLNTLIDRLDTDFVVFNNTFVETKDLRKFDDI